MTRLLSIATAVLALASLSGIADDNALPPPTSNSIAPPQGDETKPVLTAPGEASAAPGPNGRVPVETLHREATPEERLSWLMQLLRYETKGDTRRLLDTTFPYSKEIAQSEVDFDKCLDQERYKDGEKVVANLVERLRASPLPSGGFPGSGAGFGGVAMKGSDHVLLKAWEFEAALCRRAAEGEFGAGPDRRRSVALARLKRVREMAEALPPIKTSGDSGPRGVTPLGGAGAAVPLDNDTLAGSDSPFGGTDVFGGIGASTGTGVQLPDPSALAYLLLRASLFEARHAENVLDEFIQAVNAVLDHVAVNLPVPRGNVGMGEQIAGNRVDGLLTGNRAKLRDVPIDALLFHDFRTVNLQRSFATTTLAAGMPVHRLQLGTHDDVTQLRIDSTLEELFPTETIEVHVVRSTAIIRAALRNPVHEKQIVSITSTLAPVVLNQMTVNKSPEELGAGVEKLDLLGNDPNGLREVMAKLYPEEHIEVHVVPHAQAVVLRGHLTRPEYAQQVFDIAKTSYASVLYQMTPPLPEKTAVMSAPSVRTTPRSSSNSPMSSLAVVDADTSDSPTIKMSDWTIIRLAVPDVEGAADELQKQFGERASIRFGPRLDSISVKASPQVIEEVRAAASALERPTPATGKPALFNPLSVLMTGESGAAVTTDPQENDFDREARQLAMQFRAAKAGEQQGLRKQLEELTERHFVHRQQRRQVEIDELAQRIEKLKSSHHRRGENQAAIIQQRVRDLLDPNADLRWDDASLNGSLKSSLFSRVGTAYQIESRANPFDATEKMVGNAHPTGSEPATRDVSAKAESPEPTFDGTSYSEWLKMLETERKPEKLAAAMDACSRLAVLDDVSRIARSIIIVAGNFETAEQKDRITVWSAGRRSLGRLLSSDIAHGSDFFVFAEVHARIDNTHFTTSPGFVCEFLGSLGSPDSLVNTGTAIASLQAYAAPIIAALLRHHAASKQLDLRLADAAAGVWILSKTPMDDFEGLRPFVMKGFESRVVDKGHYWPWHSLKSPEYAKQFPEVVTILAEQFDKKPDVLVRDLGALGSLAEPAVPKLVARLVAVWKSREEMDRATAAGRGSPDSDTDGTWHSQMGFVFDALQKIGPKAKAAVPTLKEFLSICTANNDGDNVRQHRHWMKSAINNTLRVIGDTAAASDPDAPHLLGDFSHLTAIWRLTTSQPGQAIEGIQMSVGRVVNFSGQQGPKAAIIGLIGCGMNPRSYVIDESTTPKQFTLVDNDRKDFQQFGIYELNADRLKIEFAKPGLARPTEFSADRDKLTEGHVLLEFERDR